LKRKKDTSKLDMKKWGKSLFSRFFGFEEGIDITDEVAVLKRRNIVIKNIIFLSNLFYFFLMLIVSIVSVDERDQIFNWIVTVATFPLTFVINYFLSKLINKSGTNGSDDSARQQIAMYFAAVYLFISATLFYLKVHNVGGLETFSYILFFYVITVVALYQDKKVLLNGSLFLFSILTILHFFVTHNSPQVVNSGDEYQLKLMLVDIGLRSVIFVIYVVVLYANVSIGQYMHKARVTEKIKRQEVESDFKAISSDLFKVVLASSKSFFNIKRAHQVSQLAHKLGELYGLSESQLETLTDYSLVHLKHAEIEDISDKSLTKSYDALREKTELAATISRRIQLAQKCEDIARSKTEGILSQSFVYDMNKVQQDLDAQIILLADLYHTMRSVESYKRPLTHSTVMKTFETEFNVLFDKNLLQRFIAFNQEFANIYDNFN
jgi:HD-GYP domain-containing protein (c-di-GMP phosphodiesterase class II)